MWGLGMGAFKVVAHIRVLIYGAKFYTPPPPTPENAFPGVGGVTGGGV